MTAILAATGQRWVAALSSFDFCLTYRSGINSNDADRLSTSKDPSKEKVQFQEISKAFSFGDHPFVEKSVTLSSDSDSYLADEEPSMEILAATALTKQI